MKKKLLILVLSALVIACGMAPVQEPAEPQQKPAQEPAKHKDYIKDFFKVLDGRG